MSRLPGDSKNLGAKNFCYNKLKIYRAKVWHRQFGPFIFFPHLICIKREGI